MSSSLTAPRGYTTVAAGTVVSVHALNGQIFISWKCERDQELRMVSLVLFAIIGKRLQVPRHSVHLVWGNMEVVGDPAIGGCLMVGVLCTISKVDRELIDYWDEVEWDFKPVCVSCGDPCEDAGDDADCYWYWDASAWNCCRCQVDTLCPECHIHLPDCCGKKYCPKLTDGCWRCFQCLEELDGLDIAMTTLKRFELCFPDRLHALRAVFHWKQLWLTFAKGRV